jgi:hypothetical protein
MRLAKGLFEVHASIAFNQTDTESGRDEVVEAAFSLFHDVFPLDDFGDVFGNCSIGT